MPPRDNMVCLLSEDLDELGSLDPTVIRGSSQLIVDIFDNLSTVSDVLKIIACS